VLDGAPALASNLTTPRDVAFAYGGVLYIVDEGASCVRRRDLDGTLHTVAGICGMRGFSGDGGSATEALLDRPTAVKLDPVRHLLYIADTANERVRAVALSPLQAAGVF
jgi:sugar lactone lactonase YvrE